MKFNTLTHVHNTITKFKPANAVIGWVAEKTFGKATANACELCKGTRINTGASCGSGMCVWEYHDIYMANECSMFCWVSSYTTCRPCSG